MKRHFSKLLKFEFKLKVSLEETLSRILEIMNLIENSLEETFYNIENFEFRLKVCFEEILSNFLKFMNLN